MEGKGLRGREEGKRAQRRRSGIDQACTAKTFRFKKTSPSPKIHVARFAGDAGIESNVASSRLLRSWSTLQVKASSPTRTDTRLPGRMASSVALEGQRSGPASSKCAQSEASAAFNSSRAAELLEVLLADR